MNHSVLIVGCGLSGGVIADLYARVLNKKVLILEKRDHIGGNCYDYVDENGILMNQYGAHLFHTNDERVWSYVNKFGNWTPWEHKVIGLVDGKHVPIPVNIKTINRLFPHANISNEEEAKEWLANQTRDFEADPNNWNGEEAAKSRVGDILYNKIFKHYTKKQWDKYPEELDGSVLARIPVRTNYDDRYFSDKYQALPEHGYTKWFESLLNHNNIDVMLNTDYHEFIQSNDINSYEKVYYTGPIDRYFADIGYPKLEYRGIDFVKDSVLPKYDTKYFQCASVVNYPGPKESFTRIVEYKHFLNQETDSMHTTIVREYSKDAKEGDDPYYPIPNDRNKELYEKYKVLAEKEERVHFVGRLANYKYFNMDQAIANAISYFEKVENLNVLV
jgi:UDP-galactopyranose mutase